MNLYLSRLMLDMHSSRVISEVTHPSEMHRTLMRGFPGAADDDRGPREQFGVLFRPEVDERRGMVKAYVQSSVEPDWSVLDGLAGYLRRDGGASGYECREAGTALGTIKQGQVLAFRLRANPTKRVARDGDPLRGKRVELLREEEQIAWLAGKGLGGRDGVPGGFELLVTPGSDEEEGSATSIPRVHVRHEAKLTGRKRTSAGEHTMTHLAVDFEGLLRVTDTEALLETVRRGIGSGKAYGFGLLSLAPHSALPSEQEP